MFFSAKCLKGSACTTILCWPLLIGASCVEDPSQQREVTGWLRDYQQRVGFVSRVLDLLELLWEDKNDAAYGPAGISYIMRKHNISLILL